MPAFQVDYGDLDISPVSGHLFVVSSDEIGIAEFTPDGLFVMEHPLPSGVSSLSGIALDNDLQGAWVCSTSGVVFKLGNFPVSTFDQAASPSFGLFPNPVDDELCIRADAAYSGPVTVLDAAGRVVLQAQLNTSIARIDIRTLTAGVYTVRFNAGAMVARFVKN